MYFNTNKETGQELTKSNQRANSIKEAVLYFYQTFKSGASHQCWAYLIKKGLVHGATERNAVQARISTLIKPCKDTGNPPILYKTKNKIQGLRGKQVHVYAIIEGQINLF